MAYEKPNWKDVLHAENKKRRGRNNKTDPREKKKQVRQHYNRRRLDKDIKDYYKNNNPILFKKIEEIQEAHGVHCHTIENTKHLWSKYSWPEGGSGETEHKKGLRSRYGDKRP